jgi:hypothetical protein
MAAVASCARGILVNAHTGEVGAEVCADAPAHSGVERGTATLVLDRDGRGIIVGSRSPAFGRINGPNAG